ncbi:MAG TPA: DUF131 domain-containing protein [Candidatus Altiarchaeales archaeon]|nr:DUF131 domain-containing protein [Candidatus Altiarchaeales archaeon]
MDNFLIPAGILLVVFGFMLLFAGFILQSNEQPVGKTEARGGAVIFIGPIPIAFGTDKDSLIVVSVIMIILMMMAYFLFRNMNGF